MTKKIKEDDKVRNERIQTLGGFGRKKTQVVQSKKVYSRKKAGGNHLPSAFSAFLF
jgi:hypothetical protein